MTRRWDGVGLVAQYPHYHVLRPSVRASKSGPTRRLGAI